MDSSSRDVDFSDRSAPVVAQASSDERAAFIGRTYVHLLGAIVAFAVLEVFWFSTPFASMMWSAIAGGGRLAMFAFMGAFMGASYLANSWALSSASKPRQYAGLALYTVAESILFVPVIALAMMYSQESHSHILPRAIMITLTLFGGLTGVVFITRKDFNFMRGALLFFGFAATGLVFASIIFGFTLGLAFSYAMIAMACGYILYDTSNVMLRYRTNQHVAAALALFASVMLLFYYVLRALSSRRN